MKRKDNRVINIFIPATEKTPEISFNVLLSDLEKALKNAKENNYKVITFQIGSETIQLSVKKVCNILRLAKSQFNANNFIPANLKPYLSCFSMDSLDSNNEKILARDEEIDKLWTCLSSKQKSNAILVGALGVGKRTIALEIARQINTRQCPKEFYKHYVLEINTLKLLKLSETFSFRYEYILNNLIEFLKMNKNRIILYIDNLLHVKCELELLEFFTSFVKSYNMNIISSIDIDDFEKYFIGDSSLMRYLNPILIEEPEVNDIYPMLKTKIETFQKLYGVKISERMIRFSILTGLYLSSSNSSNPESTLDIINFALADAKRKGQKEVSKRNILSYYYIDFKLEKKTDSEEKKITAYHEAGHYLVSQISPNIKNFKNAFVSILPIEGALGLTASYEDIGKQLTCSKEYFIDTIAYSLGGRIGEATYTNEFSSGAQQDLISANSMAEKLVLSYGLSDIESVQNKSYMIGNYVKDFLLTDELRLNINEEISKVINEAYKRAENIINSNKELLDEIVTKLLEDGVLMGDELEEICQKYK